jgi:hypothetical protein
MTTTNAVKPKSISPREAVCQYMGWEFSEAADHRYHYGRTSAPIYSTSDGYVCAAANGKKAPKYDGLEWKEATGSSADYCKSRGQTVWIASGEITEQD